MHKSFKYIALAFAVLVLWSYSSAEKKRKIPPETYAKSIQLEQLSGRHETALIILDSLEYYYGLSPEAIHLRVISLRHYFENSDKKDEKLKYLDRFFALSDSLDNLCSDKKSERLGSQNCIKYIKHLDSIKTLSRQELYGIKDNN